VTTAVTAVTFANRHNLTLFGVLHMPPAAQRRSTAVLLLSPGIKMRVAPHRLYNKLAGHIVELGFPVFRFDFYGLGDSEGELEHAQLVEIYNSIQSGRYVDDTRDAMDWLQREHGLQRFIAGGLCGGAISGLLAAEQDSRIEGLLALGLPTSFEGNEEHYDQYLTRGQLTALSHGYVTKLRKPQALLRFFTFRSSYRVIWRSFRERFGGRRRSDQSTREPARFGNYNRKFGPAFFTMLRTARPILLIFGGNDRWQWEFEEKFEQPNADRLASFQHLYEKHTIANANHVLSDERWLADAMRLSAGWLERTCPVRTA
jgi:pimeloyl-ACP methyl ester carboxylesterase